MSTTSEKERQRMFMYEEAYLDEINDLTRMKLNKFAQEHSETFLGKINLYKDDTGDLWKYGYDFIYNFRADFAVPVNDELLVKMIKGRDTSPYTGTQADYPLVTAIINRIQEIGGILLIWA